MYYKSVIIHKNRIFPYFQNKVKNWNNVIIMLIIIRGIIILKIEWKEKLCIAIKNTKSSININLA